MLEHPFIFQPGIWIGEGKLTFSYSPEQIRFYTKWRIDPLAEGEIYCTQQVEKQDIKELLHNSFIFSEITPKGFIVSLENDLFGNIKGKGIISDKTLAWEFHDERGFGDSETVEGLEVYELLDSGGYRFHAEYLSNDKFRTMIDGRLWKKSEN